MRGRNIRRFCSSSPGWTLERAELRILECGVVAGRGPSEMMALKMTDPDVDAERSYSLADYYRSHQQERPRWRPRWKMLFRALRRAGGRRRHFFSREIFTGCGWIAIARRDITSAVSDQFPTSADATNAQWRVTWTAVLKRAPEGAELLQEHLRLFPGSHLHAGRALLAGAPCGRGRGAGIGTKLLR